MGRRSILIILVISALAAPQTKTPLATQTIQMSWKRGDNYYGPNFIHLESSCPSNTDSRCFCSMDFKAVKSKEFADYIESFGARKVPVIFEVVYDRDGEVAGARLLQVGNWSHDKFPENDTLLARGARFYREQHSPPAKQKVKFRSPGDCFTPLTNNQSTQH